MRITKILQKSSMLVFFYLRLRTTFVLIDCRTPRVSLSLVNEQISKENTIVWLVVTCQMEKSEQIY